jgi:hypothetical protein
MEPSASAAFRRPAKEKPRQCGGARVVLVGEFKSGQDIRATATRGSLGIYLYAAISGLPPRLRSAGALRSRQAQLDQPADGFGFGFDPFPKAEIVNRLHHRVRQ